MSTSIEALGELEDRVKQDLDFLADPSASWVRARTHALGQHVYDVVIVGGGQSGLGAAFALQREGVHNLVILDENPEGLEGPWVTYARMFTLRTPKHLTGIETGIPSLTFRAWFEAQHGRASWDALGKIPRQAWMAYLAWLRRVLKLPVRNRAHVKRVMPTGDGLFRIAIAGDNEVLSRKVVFATGIQGGGQWHVPAFIRERLPRSLYAHTSRPIGYAALVGKRIGILGAGASAFDNAQHALSLGVAEAHVFSRRLELQRINPIRHMERAGLTKHYALLDDSEKYAFLAHFLDLSQPPTEDTFARAAAHSGFHLHLGSPWIEVAPKGDGVCVKTPKASHELDFLVVSTGTATDLTLRPELADVVDDISLWGERPVGDLPRRKLIDRHPYLGPGFELTGRTPKGQERLHGLFLFNYSALASLGLSASALSGLRYALPRLAEGVAGQLFLDDRTRILEEFLAYDEVEFGR